MFKFKKSYLLIIAILICGFSAVNFASSQEDDQYIMEADLNADGNIGIFDYAIAIDLSNRIINSWLATANSNNWDAEADVNNDGVINNIDSQNIQILLHQLQDNWIDIASLYNWDADADVNNDGIINNTDLNFAYTLYNQIQDGWSATENSDNWNTEADYDNDGIISWSDYNYSLNLFDKIYDSWLSTINLNSWDADADLNNDGVINYTDLSSIQTSINQIYISWSATENSDNWNTEADYDNDGIISWSDYNYSLNLFDKIHASWLSVIELPDLVITGVDYKVDKVSSPDNSEKSVLQFTVKYKNDSDVDINKNFSVCAETGPTSEYANGFKACYLMNLMTNNIAEIKANTEYAFPQTLSYTLGADGAINEEFIFYIDRDLYNQSERDNLIDESNENNNTFTKTIIIGESSPTKKPDLIVADVQIRDGNNKDKLLSGNPIPNEKFYLWLFHKNIGDVKTNNTPFSVDMFIDEKFIERQKTSNNDYLSDLGSSIGMSDQFELNLEGGTYNIKFVLDSDDDISESDENNNTFIKTITVLGSQVDGPIITNIQVPYQLIRPTHAIITWDTDVEATSFVYYAEQGKIHQSWQGSDNLTKNHSVKIPNLKSFTTYEYQVSSKDKNGSITKSERKTFTTTASDTNENSVDPIAQITAKAQLLHQNKLTQILTELKQLRDIVKEQQIQIKYLTSLKKDVKALSQTVESAINNFITYGVDDNTKKLGAGERAAVMHSFKNAFNKLPETEEELADAIKIANGR